MLDNQLILKLETYVILKTCLIVTYLIQKQVLLKLKLNLKNVNIFIFSKSFKVINSIFKEKDIDISKPLITSCYSGISCTSLAVATYLIGFFVDNLTLT